MKTRIACALFCFGWVAAAFAAGQSSTNYTMVRDTLNTAGGDMVSTNYGMTSAVGDAVATGSITSVAYRLDNGYLAHIPIAPGVLTLLTVISKIWRAPGKRGNCAASTSNAASPATTKLPVP